MKKKSIVRFSIKDPIFNSYLAISIGGDSDEEAADFGKTFKLASPEPDKFRAGLFVGQQNRRLGFLWLKKMDVVTLAHECIHATYHLFGTLDAPIVDDTEEIFVTYHSFLMRQIIKDFKIFKKK